MLKIQLIADDPKMLYMMISAKKISIKKYRYCKQSCIYQRFCDFTDMMCDPQQSFRVDIYNFVYNTSTFKSPDFFQIQLRYLLFKFNCYQLEDWLFKNQTLNKGFHFLRILKFLNGYINTFAILIR